MDRTLARVWCDVSASVDVVSNSDNLIVPHAIACVASVAARDISG
jgi:hypothetical protein